MNLKCLYTTPSRTSTMDSNRYQMNFVEKERKALLEVKGVGPVVIQRFEEIGIHSLQELSEYEADDIAEIVADMLGTTCWKNSPQSKKAVNASIQLAKKSNVKGTGSTR